MLDFANVHAQQERGIVLDQIGFYPQFFKEAFVPASINTDVFYVLSADRRDTVFSGSLGGAVPSAYSGAVMRTADFSSWQKQGNYIVVAGGLSSPVFRIDAHALDGVAKSVLKGYYYQRSDMALDKAYAGAWSRAAGHPDTAVLVHSSAATQQRPEGIIISTPGGWYDAGDYNKYIVNSGITMGTLLGAYEDFRTYFDSSSTNIPESGNGLPGLLNEARYNLRWMLTMQDADGGVYHKCTNADFDGMVMPGVTKLPRFVVQKSTAAALDFAAVMAASARVFRGFQSTRNWADTCLRAAEKAWRWAILNPKIIYSQRIINKQYKPAINTGEYGDASFKDEWLWAAAELFTTTGNTVYMKVVEDHLKDAIQVPSWGNVGLMAYGTLVRHRKTLPPAASNIVERMKDSLVMLADKLLIGRRTTAFHTVMGQSARDFTWGSNAVAANQGMVLVWVYLLTDKKDYIGGALSNLDYLLGRNALGLCFVTGAGSHSPQHPHHRPSVADGIDAPVPGLLVGGPNPGRQDHCSYTLLETETSYLDSGCAYASNEIAINWNAPIVYLASAIEALLGKGLTK